VTCEQVMRARCNGDDGTTCDASAPFVARSDSSVALCVIYGARTPAERKRLHPRAFACSDSCSHRRTADRQKEYDRRWRKGQRKVTSMTVVNGNDTSAPSAKPAAAPISVSTSPTDATRARVVSMISTLADAGYRVRVEVDAVRLTVWRSPRRGSGWRSGWRLRTGGKSVPGRGFQLLMVAGGCDGFARPL
jgi:hypothetical protein